MKSRLCIRLLLSPTMEFGSSFILTTPLDPEVDYEEVETDLRRDLIVMEELNQNINSRPSDLCIFELFDSSVCLQTFGCLF